MELHLRSLANSYVPVFTETIFLKVFLSYQISGHQKYNKKITRGSLFWRLCWLPRILCESTHYFCIPEWSFIPKFTPKAAFMKASQGTPIRHSMVPRSGREGYCLECHQSGHDGNSQRERAYEPLHSLAPNILGVGCSVVFNVPFNCLQCFRSVIRVSWMQPQGRRDVDVSRIVEIKGWAVWGHFHRAVISGAAVMHSVLLLCLTGFWRQWCDNQAGCDFRLCP